MLTFRLSILLISIGWLFLLPVYVQPNRRWWVGLVLGAWLVASWGSGRNKLLAGERSRLKSAFYYLLVGAAFVSTIGLLQAGVLPFYTRFDSVYHSAGVFGPVISGLLNLFGFDAVWQGNIVAVQDFREVIRFSITLEKLAFFPLLFFFIAEVVSLFLFKVQKIWRRLLLTAVCLFGYSIARLVVLCALYVYAKDVSLFWNPVYILLSLLPLPLMLERLNTVAVTDQLPAFELAGRVSSLRLVGFWKALLPALRALRWKPASAAAMTTIIAAFGLTGYLAYRDPGEKKQGRVLIDEAHSNWEWTTRPFDKEWFGQQSVYNYYLARDFANHYFRVEVNTDKPLTNDLLGRYDVLVVKTPTALFSETEKRAVYEFVRQGGGLFLIGDHTNLFGMSTVLNDLARPFQLKFNFDDTFVLMTGSNSSYAKPEHLYHPIVRNISEFGFETSCTLDVPLSAEPVMIGSGLGREWIDYSHKNFFGNMRLDSDEDYGLFVQAAAVKYGEGRVVAFSDSTVFSNFSFFWPGKSEFFVNALDYLNRRNKHGDTLNVLALAIGLASLLASIFLIRRFDLRLLVPIYTLLGAMSFWFSADWINHLNAHHYTILQPHTRYTTVAFESQYSNIGLTEASALLAEQMTEEQLVEEHEHGHEHGPIHREYETFRTFYINLARLGVFPTVRKSLHEALHVGQIVVIINPGKRFAEGDVHRLDHFMQQGGRVLLLDSVTNDSLVTNQLLKRFNARVGFSPLPIKVSLQIPKSEAKKKNDKDDGSNKAEKKPEYEKQTYGIMTLPRLEVNGEGHRPIFSDDGNRLLAVEIKRGKGSLVVFVDSAHFSNAVMGRVYKKPSDEELRAYKDMFFLFENYLLKEAKEAEVAKASAQR